MLFPLPSQQLAHWRQLEDWSLPWIITLWTTSFLQQTPREGIPWLSNASDQTSKLQCQKLARIMEPLSQMWIINAVLCEKVNMMQHGCNYLKQWRVCWMLMKASAIAVAYIIHAKIWCQVKIPSPVWLTVFVNHNVMMTKYHMYNTGI